jgi:hypothetical protein
MGFFDAPSAFLIGEANPCEGMRVHYLGSKWPHLIDFTGVFLL